MLMNPTFAIQGGLGNQLSQWFFAHSITESHEFHIDPLYESSQNMNRNLEVQELIERCPHVAKNSQGAYSPMKMVSLFHLFDRIWEFKKFRFLIENFGYIREDPRFDQEQTMNYPKTIRYGKGYFQKQGKIESIFEIVESELIPIVDKAFQGVKSKFDLIESYDVLHVRRGDYETTNFTPINIGTLSDDYFVNWSKERKHSRKIVLTENKDDVLNLVQHLHPITVIDKSLTNPWETLALMYGAENFLGSNSSLSWWGARLCSSRGGNVWLPNQWSLWNNIAPEDYHFPKCHIADSLWRESGNI
jgi:hypothetical protein